MATLTRTFTFATNAEGFTANPAAPSGTSHTYSSSVGNPAGSLQTRTTGRNRSRTMSWWDWTGTWQQLGVPAGSTVTAIQLTGAQTRCSEYNVGAASIIGPYELRDGGGGTLLGTLWGGRTVTSATTAWTATTAQAAVSVPAGYQDASSTIRIRLADQQATANNNSAAVTSHDDQVSLLITYTPAEPPQTAPTGLTHTVTDKTVDLSWNPLATAAWYRVFRDGVQVSGDQAATSFQDTGRAYGATYAYTVLGGNVNGPGPATAPRSVTIPTTTPGPVQNLRITDVTPVGTSGTAWEWNGSVLVPLAVTIWDGTAEVPISSLTFKT